MRSHVDLVSRKTRGVGNVAGLVQSFSYGEALRKPLAPWPPLYKGKEVAQILNDTFAGLANFNWLYQVH